MYSGKTKRVTRQVGRKSNNSTAGRLGVALPALTRIFFKSFSIEMDYGVAEIINRVIKYLIEGLVVAAAALLIPRKSLGFDEVASLAVLAAVVFAILDVVSPSMGMTARQGASFGIGANLVGFPRGL
jgi:hypothetical protein